MATELTQAYVKSLFDYHEDGYLIWKVQKAKRTKIGERAGSEKKDGRLCVNINGKLRYTSRIIFLWHHGYLPLKVDHIDRNIKNEKIINLRAATVRQNNCNRAAKKDGKSIYLGVGAKRDRWYASIRVNKKGIHIGNYLTQEKAALAYNREAVKYHGEFANLNIIQANFK